MNLLLSVLTALPLFTTAVESPGSGRVTEVFQSGSGYIAAAAELFSWAGQGNLVFYTLDQYGTVSETSQAGFSGEPVSAAEVNNGTVLLCIDRIEGTARLAAVGTETDFVTEFPGEFLGGGAVCVSGDTIFVAGNDTPGESPVRTSRVSTSGEVLENSLQPESFHVEDAGAYQGEFLVLGVKNLTGWLRESILLSPGNGIVFTAQYGTDRYCPEAFTFDGAGVCVLSNAYTSANNMKSEIHLTKLDQNMNTEWTANLTGISSEQGKDIIHTEAGYTVTGWTNSLPFSETNRSDLMMAHFSNSGESLWYRSMGSLSPDYGLSISSVSDGGYVVGGCTTADLYNCWILKTDSQGFTEPQGTGNPEFSLLNVRPQQNPMTGGFLSVEVSGEPGSVIRAVAYSICGRVVGTVEQLALPAAKSTLAFCENLPAGVYTVSVRSESFVASCRLVVTGGDQ